MRPLVPGRAAGFIGLVLACLAILGPSRSQATGQAPALADVIAAHVAARGGADRWRALRSVRMTGRAVAEPGREALVSREVKRPGRIRTEFTFQGLTSVYAYDGKQGWHVAPVTGVFEPQALDEENLHAAIEQADLDGAFIDSQKKGYALELMGRELVAGREAWRIRVTSGAGASHDALIDVETSMLLRIESTRVVRGHPVQLETTFGNYRAVGGLTFAHTLEFAARGRPERVVVTIEQIELNPRLDDDRFRRPAGTRR